MTSWTRQMESIERFNVTANSTIIPAAYTLTNTQIIFICTCLCISICAIIGNLLSLMAISQSKYWHTPNGLLLANLAVVDFLVGFICLPLIIAVVYMGRYVPSTLCQMQAFILGVLNCTSINTAVVISIDRCIAVAQPYYHTATIDRSKVSKAIALAWLFSIILSMIPIIARGMYGLGLYDNRSQLCWLFMRDYKNNYIANSIFITAMLLAIAIVLICYSIIFSIAYKKSTATALYNCGNSYRNIKKTILTTSLIIGMKIICWLPMSIISLLAAYTTVTLTPALEIVANIFAFANSPLNPAIYISTSSVLRQKSLQILLRKRRIENHVTISSLITRNA